MGLKSYRKGNKIRKIGGNDKLVPENVSKELTDLLPDVKVKKIGGATHAIPWSHAEELSFHIKDFLVD